MVYFTGGLLHYNRIEFRILIKQREYLGLGSVSEYDYHDTE